jgi:P4 family phage/plasmid primase-like protien
MASDLKWVNASKQSPCTVCGKTDWCRFTSGGEIIDCMRDCGTGGVQKLDKIGQVFFRHFMNTGITGKGGGGHGDAGSHAGADVDIEAPLRNHKERREPELLHAVYTALLDELVLYDHHVEHMADKRKLTRAQLQRLGYRSFPSGRLDQQRVVDKLLTTFTAEQLTSVPGFDRPKRDPVLLDDGGTLDVTEVRICGCDGYLLAQRDDHGRIRALVLRRDLPEPKPGGDLTKKPSRYLPFTAYDDTGAAAAVGVHVPLHAPEQRKTVRVIEGIVKADTATDKTGMLTVGIPSGGRWKTGIKLAEQLGAEMIVITPDADTQTNKGICMTLVHACHELAARGGSFQLETWDAQLGKGLDDVLNHGHADKVQVHEGAAVWKTLKGWLATCGAPADLHAEARILLDGITDKMHADSTYCFKPNIAEALAVLDPATVEAQRILIPIKAALRGTAWRDLDHRMKKFKAKKAKADTTKHMNDMITAGKKVFVRGDEAELALALLDDLTPVGGGWKSNHDISVFDGGRLHIYNADTGIYDAIEDSKLISHVAAFAGSPVAGRGSLRVSNSSAKGSVKLAQANRAKPNFFNTAPLGIAFKNGFLVVDPIGRTVKLVPNHPRHRVRNRYEFDYTPGATPKRFMQTMQRWFQNKPEQQMYIDCAQEFIGACIAGMAPTFGKILLLTGQGNDGKSTFVKIVIGIMPKGSVSNVAPQSFDREYNRAELEAKLLNAVFDLPENDLLDSGPLKAITVGDPIEARRPHGCVFTLQSRAGQLYNCNTLFRTRDTSKAFRRRWIIFEFDNPIGDNAGEVPNESLAEEILAEEQAAIVSWAIDGLIRRLAAGKYTIPSASDTTVSQWLGENDTIQQFVTTRLAVIAPEERTNKKHGMKGEDIYPEYKTWCRDDGYQPLSSARFLKKLRAHLKLTDKDVHTNDGNYYPVQLRAAADQHAKIREAIKEDAELDRYMKSLDISLPPPNAANGGMVLDDDLDDDAARRRAYRSVYGHDRDDEDEEGRLLQ